MNPATGIGLTLALLTSLLSQAHDSVVISEARKDDHGFLVHTVRSPYQAGTTQVRVLPPDKRTAGRSAREREALDPPGVRDLSGRS